MNILVIGGSKFIGWRLVELLGTTDHTVTVINRGNHSREYPSNVTHHIADRNNYEKMRAAIGDTSYDTVFDMCAYVERDMRHTIKLFGDRTRKYVFISTAATYLEPLVMPIAEDYAQGAHSAWGAYGSSKLACEQVLLSAHKDSGFPTVIVRPSYVYGVGNSIDRETFLFDRITKDRTILVPSDGQAVIQLGEVTDLCRALLGIAETPKGIGECYNVSGNELITLNSLVRLAAKIVGKGYKAVHVNHKDFGMTDRDIFPFDNVSYFTTSDTFSKEFDWSPQVSLIDGLTNAYNEWLGSSHRLPTSYEKEDVVLKNFGVVDA
ncbi:MAG TPA: NAD-dependent epimerase/dehydratase family protein [Candidatus Saccharimonadales bacterium]|nr:NAD-dependent epimerase/dehydratase family protein [Candidatus Saccharimonadales bacterium]